MPIACTKGAGMFLLLLTLLGGLSLTRGPESIPAEPKATVWASPDKRPVYSAAWDPSGTKLLVLVSGATRRGCNVALCDRAKPGAFTFLEEEFRLATSMTWIGPGSAMIGTEFGELILWAGDGVRHLPVAPDVQQVPINRLIPLGGDRILVGRHTAIEVIDTTGRREWCSPLTGGMKSLDVTADGSRAVVATQSNRILLFETRQGQVCQTLTTRLDETPAAISPDGRFIAGGGPDGALTVWDTDTGDLLWVRSCGDRQIATLSYSPDGQVLAVGGYNEGVSLWNTAGELVNTLDLTDVCCLRFSPTGQQLVCTTLQGTVHVQALNTILDTASDLEETHRNLAPEAERKIAGSPQSRMDDTLN